MKVTDPGMRVEGAAFSCLVFPSTTVSAAAAAGRQMCKTGGTVTQPACYLSCNTNPPTKSKTMLYKFEGGWISSPKSKSCYHSKQLFIVQVWSNKTLAKSTQSLALWPMLRHFSKAGLREALKLTSVHICTDHLSLMPQILSVVRFRL